MTWEDIDWQRSELTAELRAVVDAWDGGFSPPIHALSVEAARSLVAQRFGPGAEPEPVKEVWDTEIPGDVGPVTGADEIPVRLYVPQGDPPYPVLVWFHGGGFVLGDVGIADNICRRFANAGECAVVSVDYRLAPEHPFPAGLADCYAATAWAVEHADVVDGDPDRVGVGGGSAGGNLAAAVSLLARDLGTPPLAYQLVVYPMLDDDTDRPSYLENPAERADFESYWERYLESPVDAGNPYAVPLRETDFGGMPPTEVVTVEFDVLREEGREYAEHLREAGVPVEHNHVEDVIHPYWNLDVPRARESITAAARRFRDSVVQ